jgi:hypothetical protein
MSDQTRAAPRPRAELIRRHSLRRAWLCVAGGLLIPFLALVGVGIGWSWRRAAGGGQLALIAVGATVFVGRLTLWLMGIP